jgi:hypothetical protein
VAPWEVLNKLKELSAKLAQTQFPPELAEVPQLLGTLVYVVETQQHDLQVLKATVARLEHHVRHRPAMA